MPLNMLNIWMYGKKKNYKNWLKIVLLIGDLGNSHDISTEDLGQDLMQVSFNEG